MNTSTWIYWLYLAMHLFVLLPLTGYLVQFHRRTEGHWWNSVTGKALMLLALALVANILPAMVGTVWILASGRVMPFRVLIGSVAYCLVGCALWGQWWAFRRAQREASPAQSEPDN